MTVTEKEKMRALEEFKALTHSLLDVAGVPQFPEERCRVRARIAWLVADRDSRIAKPGVPSVTGG